MTTPKRNEAVAIRPYLWITQEDQRRVSQDEDCVIACPHIASAPSDAVYLYHSDDYAALQGEVSRLREVMLKNKTRAEFFEQVIREVLEAVKKGRSVGFEHPMTASEIIMGQALNLEPPTDGR